ncbi:MAG TPA: Lsr2 family protein [Microlunatus sp.]
MASRTVITLIDDLSGKETGDDGRTVAFSLEGVDYRIDLGEKNLIRLEKALHPFISAATRVDGPTRKRKISSSAAPAAANVREWARLNGYEVSDRGRVPGAARAAYNAAH